MVLSTRESRKSAVYAAFGMIPLTIPAWAVWHVLKYDLRRDTVVTPTDEMAWVITCSAGLVTILIVVATIINIGIWLHGVIKAWIEAGAETKQSTRRTRSAQDAQVKLDAAAIKYAMAVEQARIARQMREDAFEALAETEQVRAQTLALQSLQEEAELSSVQDVVRHRPNGFSPCWRQLASKVRI